MFTKGILSAYLQHSCKSLYDAITIIISLYLLIVWEPAQGVVDTLTRTKYHKPSNVGSSTYK